MQKPSSIRRMHRLEIIGRAEDEPLLPDMDSCDGIRGRYLHDPEQPIVGWQQRGGVLSTTTCTALNPTAPFGCSSHSGCRISSGVKWPHKKLSSPRVSSGGNRDQAEAG